MSEPRRVPTRALALLSFALPAAAEAYIGPGAGLSVIGTVIALAAAVALAVVGFLWYPIKRMRANAKKKKSAQSKDAEPKNEREAAESGDS